MASAAFEWYLWQKNVGDEGVFACKLLWEAGRGITR